MPNETQFTRDRWYVEDRVERAVILAPECGREIASVEGTDDPDRGEEQEANAHVLAAAPEMYEALREILSVHKGSSAIPDRARAALAKADGK